MPKLVLRARAPQLSLFVMPRHSQSSSLLGKVVGRTLLHRTGVVLASQDYWYPGDSFTEQGLFRPHGKETFLVCCMMRSMSGSWTRGLVLVEHDVRAIGEFKKPTSMKAFHYYLGMINFYCRFVPVITTV